MKCVCHEGTSILDGFSAIWFSFWIALNWIWNSLGLAFGLAFGSIVDYVLKNFAVHMFDQSLCCTITDHCEGVNHGFVEQKINTAVWNF